MSVRVMSLVWKYGPDQPAERLMMLAIADNADDNGLAWPSRGTLAKKVCVDERSVKRIIRRLEKSGWLHVAQGGGQRNGYGIPNRYQINMEMLTETSVTKSTLGEGDPGSPYSKSKGTLEASKGTLEVKYGDPSVPLTIKNHQVEPKEGAQARVSGEAALDRADRIINDLEETEIFDSEFAAIQRDKVNEMRARLKNEPESEDEIWGVCSGFWTRLEEHGIVVAQ